MFIIHPCSTPGNADISSISAYPDEEEILWQPFAHFKILNKNFNYNKNRYEIELENLPIPEEHKIKEYNFEYDDEAFE